jgi:hypothetical protein
MRQDRGYASAHIVATDDRRLPDFHARDIGDCVERLSRQNADL